MQIVFSAWNAKSCFQGKIRKIFQNVVWVSVAQLDARPTEDEEVAGSTPAGSATFFHGDWSWNTFYGYSLPSAD